MICPFSILIDTAEQFAYDFTGIKSDADNGYEPMKVQTQRVCLGRHPNSLGDYTLEGGVGRCHIERKSMEDGHSTLLGFSDGHRARFEQELANLAKLECACVIVECEFDAFVANAKQYGVKTAAQNAKILYRSVIAYQQDYKVPWFFCDGRQYAQMTAFWFLYRFWEKHLKPSKARRAARTASLLKDV